MKKLISIIFILSIFTFSNNVNGQTKESPTTVNINQFDEKAESLIGQEIKITGTVVHVCEHGGKRMFIIGDNPEKRIKITAGEEVSSFKTELEGSSVTLIGTIQEKRIDEAFLTNWEAELAAEKEAEVEHKIHTGKDGHEEHADHDNSETVKQISSLRKQIKASKKGYLSILSIDCNAYTENK